MNGIVDMVMRMEEEWLAGEMAKRMPPDLFLRAYGNYKCQQDVVQWLEAEGYSLVIYPCGTKELRRGDELLTTFAPPRAIEELAKLVLI